MDKHRRSRSESQPVSLTWRLSFLIAVLIVGVVVWISVMTAGRTAEGASIDLQSPVSRFNPLSAATVTPTVTLTPTPEGPRAYLPLVQKDVVIPGAVSVQEVYTTDYAGERRSVFQPCQAVAVWLRVQNKAEILQTAVLDWQAEGPAGYSSSGLDGHAQVRVPPGEHTYRFVGSLDLDAPAGEYRLEAWSNEADDQPVAGIFSVTDDPIDFHYLGGQTAVFDPRNYDTVVRQEIERGRQYQHLPARFTDEFTFEDESVIQITTWEGIRDTSTVDIRRFRPDGTRWGRLLVGWSISEDGANCVRRGAAHWWIDEWVEQTPGEWRFDVYAGDARDVDSLELVDRMYVTIEEGSLR